GARAAVIVEGGFEELRQILRLHVDVDQRDVHGTLRHCRRETAACWQEFRSEASSSKRPQEAPAWASPRVELAQKREGRSRSRGPHPRVLERPLPNYITLDAG